MANDSLRRKPTDNSPKDERPNIWASGKQRPPFDIRAFGRASLFLSREAVAPIHAWAARTARRVAVNVKNGAGRIPEAKLGRAAPYVPSHLRVAAWIKNLAVTFAHASASADPDVKRGNALVVEIEPHLWSEAAVEAALPPPPPEVEVEVEPVVLAEPEEQAADPLASIRDDLDGKAPAKGGLKGRSPTQPAGPPAPPGQVATMAMQMTGYVLGWGVSFAALPFGALRTLWLYAKGVDMRTIGAED